MYAALLLIVALLQSLLLHQYFHSCLVLGMRLRSVIISAVYRKVGIFYMILKYFGLFLLSRFIQQSLFQSLVLLTFRVFLKLSMGQPDNISNTTFSWLKFTIKMPVLWSVVFISFIAFRSVITNLLCKFKRVKWPVVLQ